MRWLPLLLLAGAAATVATGAASASPGAQLWAQAGCGGCHTLAAAGSSGQVGPNLDQLRPSASRIALQITDGGAAMPSFGHSLSGAEIDSLAAWIASVAGGGSSSAGSGTGSSAAAGGASGPGGAITGMSVAEVRRLQAELARLGFFHHVVTGYYGSVTTAAVKRFQRSAGLKPDGVWGPQSARALKRRLAAG